jgi:hypothetical protein
MKKCDTILIRAYREGATDPFTVYSRTSSDASWDMFLMTGFIELEQAAARRKVGFEPHALGGLVLISPHASLWALLRGFFKARREALANTGRIGWNKRLEEEPAKSKAADVRILQRAAIAVAAQDLCLYALAFVGLCALGMPKLIIALFVLHFILNMLPMTRLQQRRLEWLVRRAAK